jgi:putative transposase
MQAPIRKKLHRREIRGGSRFITFSCYQRLPLLGHPAVRDVFAEALARTRVNHGVRLFAWVAMPEHVHLLLEPAEGQPLSLMLESLKKSVMHRVLKRWRQIDAPILEQLRTPQGPLRYWQKGGGFDRNVRDDEEFCKTVTYIHRNPVKRGLADAPTDWKWSSARWWLGQRDVDVRCDPPPGWDRGLKDWKGFL